MKNLFLVIVISLGFIACDKLKKADQAMDAVKATGPKMDTTNQNMSKMAHDQCLALTVQGLSNKEYSDMVNPIAFKVAPWAKGFAECTNLQDLLDYAELRLLEVDDGSFVKTVSDDGSEQAFSVREKAEMNQQKQMIISGLSQIAGLLPESLVDQLVEEARGGAYSPTAMKLLVLRYSFIKDFKFDSARMGKTFTNPAMALLAFSELEKADRIAKLDLKNELAFTTTGLVKLTDQSENPNFNLQIDHSELKSQWRRLLRKVDVDQPIQKMELGQTEAELNSRKADSVKKIESLKTKIQNKIDYWTKTLP